MFPALLPAIASTAAALGIFGGQQKAAPAPKPTLQAKKTIAAPKSPTIATGYNSPVPQASYASSVPAPVYAPKLDFSALQAQARQSVEGGVNAYYTDQLNKFLNQQAVAKQQQQQATDTSIQNLNDQLQNTLGENQIKQTRTGEDVTKNLSDIANTANQFQTDSGTQAEADRLALAKTASTGGLGAQQLETQQAQNATTEGRQAQDSQNKAADQNIFKARTFEDLARSGEQATSATAKGTKQAQVDLANFIQNQGLDLTQQQDVFAKQKQADILSQAQQQQGILVQNFINSIANPAQRQAALQAYGGLIG